jgi:sulfate adenylyltransferase subunit 1
METVFVCINKMDLVDFSEEVFSKIRQEVKSIAKKIGFEGSLHFIPIVAKDGDNVVLPSSRMDWYRAQTLLDFLEATPVHKKDETLPARFGVQLVIRPHTKEHHDYRGYAGRLSSGTLSVGEEVICFPSLNKTRISGIHRGEEQLQKARAGDSISLELEEDVDLSRGNMLVSAEAEVKPLSEFTATVNWMESQPLQQGKAYLLQHGVQLVRAKIIGLQARLDMETMESAPADRLALNDIGKIRVKTAKPVFADPFSINPRNGAFILIDEFSNNTVGVGFIE